MPVEFEFHFDPDFMLVTWLGEITEEEAIEAGDAPNGKYHSEMLKEMSNRLLRNAFGA